MSTDGGPYLEFTAPDGTRLHLGPFSDADDWVTREFDFWSWLRAEKGSRFCGEAAKRINQKIDELKAASDRSKTKEHNHVLRETCIQFANDRSYLFSFSREARFIEYLRKTSGPNIASFALAQFIKSPISLNEKCEAICLEGQMRAVLFLSGVDGNVRLEAEELQGLRDDYKNKFATTHAAAEEQFASNSQELLKQFEACKAELEQIRKDFIAINALQAPANYWEQRRKAHAVKTRWLGAMTIIAGASAIAGLVYWSLHAPSAIDKVDQAWKAIPLGIPFLLCFVAAFWLVRILVRLFLSNYHLATDADERVALVKSYQALRRDPDNQLGGESLEIILKQIFRHAATGVVTEDSAPQIPVEILTRGSRP